LQLVNADESIATGLGFVAREGSDPMITVSASSTAAQAFATLAENDMYAPPPAALATLGNFSKRLIWFLRARDDWLAMTSLNWSARAALRRPLSTRTTT
jgi:hypothetical protein